MGQAWLTPKKWPNSFWNNMKGSPACHLHQIDTQTFNLLPRWLLSNNQHTWYQNERGKLCAGYQRTYSKVSPMTWCHSSNTALTNHSWCSAPLSGHISPHSVLNPTHKGGDISLVKNCRPVELTYLTKVFKKILRNKIMAFVEEKSLLNDIQHSLILTLQTSFTTRPHASPSFWGQQHWCHVPGCCKGLWQSFHSILLHKMKRLGITGKAAP